MTKTKVQLGTVSHATMRVEDLLPCFACELEYYDDDEQNKGLIDEANARAENSDDWNDDDHESAQWILDDLFEALNACADDMPYVYFGSHIGDGSDYGFWIDWDGLEDDVRCDVVKQIKDPGNIDDQDDDEPAYYLFVNDHGNSTLYDTAGNVLWDCV